MIKGLRAEIWEKEPKRVSQFSLSEEVRGLLKVRYHLPGSWRMRRIGLDEEKRKLARGQVRSLSGIYSCMRQCLSSTYCGPGTGNVALNDIVEDPCPRGSHVLEGQKDLK